MSSPMVASLSGHDEVSTTSHASSSRHAGLSMARTASSGTRGVMQPMSLAEALGRSGDDPTLALDAVLTERNKLCLEMNKLSTENVRLWTLMKKMRRENDELKSARTGPASTSSPLAQTMTSTAPLASALEHHNGDARRTARAASRQGQVSPTGQRDAPPADLVPETISSYNSLPRGNSDTFAARAASPSVQSSDPKTVDATDSDTHTTVSTSEAYAPEASTSANAPPSIPSSSRLVESPTTDGGDARALNGARSNEIGRGSIPSDVAPPPRSGSLRRIAVGGSTGNGAPERSAGAKSTASSDQQRSIIQQRAAAARAQQALAAENIASGSKSQDYDLHGARSASNAQRGALPQGKSSSVDAAAPVSTLSRGMSDMTLAADHSREHSTTSSVQVQPTGPTHFPHLEPKRLPYTTVKLAGSSLATRPSGEVFVSTYMIVTAQSPADALQTWRIEKSYDDLVALDSQLRARNASSQTLDTYTRAVHLPDRAAFQDHAPSRSDVRTSLIAAYMATVLETPLPSKDDVCTFLCTNVIETPQRNAESLSKEGLLTRKGQDQSAWLARWYVLNVDALDFYGYCNGPLLGSIRIRGAQIGRQQRNLSSENDENAYRHAFLILEARQTSTQQEQKQVVRHVLCAEDDDDRDEWVDVLVRAIDHLNAEAASAADAGVLQPSKPSSKGTSTPIAQQIPTSDVPVARPDHSLTAWTRVKENSAAQLVGPQRNEVPLTAHYPATPQENASAQMTQGGPMGTAPQAPSQRQTRPQIQARPASSPSDAKVAAMAAAAGDYARSPRVDAQSRKMSGGAQVPVRRAMSPRREVSQPSYPVERQQLHAHRATTAIFGQERATSPQTSSSHSYRAVSQPLAHQDVRRPSLTSSSRPSQDAAMVSSGSQEGSSKERSRPSISGPLNGTPIPVGYKFGARDDQSSSMSISSSGGVSNHAMPTSNIKADTSSSTAPEIKKRFWQRFGGGNEKQSSKSKRVFGVPLAEAIAASTVAEALDLPSVVYRCIEFLEDRNAAMEEGIYRLSGSSAVIKALTERFNAQGDVNLLAPTEPDYDPHAIAGLLKQYLRELPSSVLTPELHLDFVRANDIADRRERVNELGSLVSMLPQANYSLLRTLCSHLIKVIEHQDVNRMNMRNVGIVFSPTLTIPAGVFALFLTEFDWVFYTDAKGDPAPRFIDEDILPPDEDELGIASRNVIRTPRMGSSPAMPSMGTPGGRVRQPDARNKRNSLRYNEAEAERLLGPLSRHRLSAQREDLEASNQSSEPHTSSFDAHAQAFAHRFGGSHTDSSQLDTADSGFPMPIMGSPNASRIVHARTPTEPASPTGPQGAFTPTTPIMGSAAGTPRMPYYGNGHMASPSGHSPYRSYEGGPPSPSPIKYNSMSSPGQHRGRRPMQTEMGNVAYGNGHPVSPSPSRSAMRNGGA